MDIGLGVGWQKDEYDACGVPWEGRFALLEEQVRVCRLLWGEDRASFAGEHVRFERISARPFPTQGTGLPVWFGVAPRGRNIDRIAELGDGWLPMERDPDKLRPDIAKLRKGFAARGRDPAQLQVGVAYEVARGENGRPDLDATLAQTPAYAAAGATIMRIDPVTFCRSREDYAPFLDRVLQVKRSG